MNPRKTEEVELENSAKIDPLHDLEGIPELEFSHTPRDGESEISRLGQGWTSYAWLLWNHRDLFSKIVFRVLVAATVLVFIIPPKYDSTSNIMPPEKSDSGALLSMLSGRVSGGTSEGGAGGGLAALAGNFLGTGNSGALYVELIHSRTVQDHIIDRFGLKKIYWVRYEQDARKILDKRTVVEQDRKSGVITISVTDSKPERAQAMTQAYVEELDRLLSQVSTSSARRERIFIEQRLITVKSDLEDAEKQFSAFASKNTMLDLKDQSKAEVEAAAVLQGQLIAAQSELSGLSAIYTDNNVRVRSLRARMDELRRQLHNISGTDASLAADALPDATASDLYPSIRRLPLLGVQWADLYRRAKIQETVFQLLTQQYELTKIQEAKEIPSIRVIDPANFPEKKSWPPRLLIILAMTIISLVGTTVWIIGSDYWKGIDRSDSRKMLAGSIWDRVRQRMRSLAARLHLSRTQR